MDEFALAWLVYALSGVATMVGCWYLTRRWPAFLRDLVRVVFIVLLAVPAPVVGFDDHYAPAAMVAVFEGVFRREGDPVPALAALATALLAGLLLVLLLVLVRRVLGRRSNG